MDLKRLHSNLVAIRNNWDSILEALLNEFAPDFHQALRDQLRVGIAGDGNQIGEYFSPEYISFKESIGSITVPNVDLLVTGAFYESIHGLFEDGELWFEASDPKAVKLVDQYGEEILELTLENVDKVASTKISPALEKLILKLILK